MSRLVELRTLEQELVKQLAQLAALPESRKLRSWPSCIFPAA